MMGVKYLKTNDKKNKYIQKINFKANVIFLNILFSY